jgi:transposase
LRAISSGRENYLFIGSPSAAIACTPIKTGKLNGFDPQTWLTEILLRILDYKINHNYKMPLWSAH